MRKSIKVVLIIVLMIITGCTANNEVTNNEKNQDKNNENSNEQTNHDDSEEEQEINDNENSVTESIDIVDDKSITALVNKFNSLSESYVPEDLVSLSVPTVLENPEVNQLREVASDALTDMFATAEEEHGFFLFARSGYRSYDTQVHLFNGYAEQHGEEAANTYSAKPGYSEHQTGLVMDITSETVQFQLTEQFGDTDEGKWVADNAHKFGFIIRYPEDKEDITGYIYEPWHLRYLGKDVATAVYESSLTYEEFLVEEGVIDHVQFEK